ncbi:MAG: glycine cleavage system aminomethyltransferase GcvT [Alphaproteobacteria bacterium]|nr:glycine cleavage system aminomethyltransferase GcvT [Alphaproteobacteria bacterium]
MSEDAELKQTPLYSRHVALGAKMVPFTGYDMPVQYPAGIMAEHNHTRSAAGLFDVSHMGQCYLHGPDHATTAAALETLTPGDFLGLEPGQQSYTQFTNETGGILDDLMVTRPAGEGSDGSLFLVVNAACKEADFARLEAGMPSNVSVEILHDKALLALQGPAAHDVMSRLGPEAAAMSFMQTKSCTIAGLACHASRSGYTGEDGFEISVSNDDAGTLMDTLLEQPEVEPIGLGARDSLRLEAGLCLYGHDIDETTSPAEAGLVWSIGKRRRVEGGFPGAERIQKELGGGRTRFRVGIIPEGRAPAREGTIIEKDGVEIGVVTSGGFGPTVGGPVAMGYVAFEHRAADTPIDLIVRGKALPATITKMPFAPHRYRR